MSQGTILTIEDIRRRLENQPPAGQLEGESDLPMLDNGSPRCAAVLLPLVCQNGGWSLLFTRRSEQVYDHKGQVSFPGGACEPEDASLEETALREAREEIGLEPADVQILGRLPEMRTVSFYNITPVVGVMPWPYPLRLYEQEVSRAFTIPIDWLADAKHWEERVEPRYMNHKIIYYQLYDGELLWGISARMTVILMKILGLS
jgi:8-oxo-dGTP pyrophosphatase MutT (NUDIX family)